MSKELKAMWIFVGLMWLMIFLKIFICSIIFDIIWSFSAIGWIISVILWLKNNW